MDFVNFVDVTGDFFSAHKQEVTFFISHYKIGPATKRWKICQEHLKTNKILKRSNIQTWKKFKMIS